MSATKLQSRTETNRSPYAAAVVITLLLTLPPMWALIEHERHQLPWRESHLWIAVVIMAFVISPLIVGFFAARRRPHHGLRTACFAVTCASFVVVLIAVIRKLLNSRSFDADDLEAYAIYLLFTVAVGTVSGYISVRSLVTKADK